MKKLLLLIGLLYGVALFAWPGRVSKEYSGIGSALQTTYKSADSSNVTSGYACAAYSTLTAYISVSVVSGDGIVQFFFEGSPDNSYWYHTGTQASLTQVGDTVLILSNAPLFFRLKANFQSGDSITVDKVQVSGKE